MTSPGYHIHIKPRSGLATPNLPDIWHYRDLLWEMAKRDIKVRYRQTALGVVWVVLQPAAQALVYGLVFGLIAGLPSEGEVPYVLFVYLNLMGWGFFSGAISRGAGSLVGQAGLINKVYFPRVLIPISSLISGLVDMVVVFALLLLMFFLYSVPLGPQALTLPLWVLLLVLTAGGVSFWLSSLAVYYRDFRNASGLLIQLWMYITPVVYSESVVPDVLRPLFDFNPVTAPILGIRWALLGTEPPGLASLAASAAVAVLLFFTGMIFLRRVERTLVDVV